MARSNGPFGPPGAPLRRRPGDDPYGAPPAQSSGQWPPQPQQGYGDAPLGAPTQGYHFPPPEAAPAYGYGNQQVLPPQQWGQQGAAQAYDLSYQNYAPAGDPGPFQPAAHHQQHQGYAETDADFNEEYFEDEEPRRGKRWILICVALVGAIGVGGALAYTYRSLVAPSSGRVPVVKADPNVKVKPKDVAEKKLPGRIPEEPARAAEPTAAEEPPAETGPRSVKTIPITPGGPTPPPAQVAAPSIPGITLYQPPQAQPPAAQPPAAAPPVVPAPPKAAPPARVALGNRPPPAESDDDPPAAAAPPVKRPPAPVHSAPAAPRPAVAKAQPAKAPSSGLGYVAVLSSKKSHMDALKEYADLQQRYPEVLGTRSFDVQEADLSARGLGTMYRVVVGPPGSHNAATGLCTQLKTAGYVGCWVKEF
jgi:hypothetical protein